MQMKMTKKGFTLIELLVVIAIIGILSSVVLASLNSARAKSRDAKRISDLKQLQIALELSYDANTAYPAAINTASMVTPGYISVVPADPGAGNPAYSYAQSGGGTGYCLGANLEGVIPQGSNAACVTSLGGSVDYAVSP